VQKLSTRETVVFQRAIATLDHARERWTIHLPRLLRSPNATLWKHWRVKQRERRIWQGLVSTALLDAGSYGARLVAATLQGRRRVWSTQPQRLTIERHCARPQQLIRDPDNLAFCAKHLVDALVAVGLLHDDTPRWCQREPPVQIVDGQASTVVILEPIPKGDPTP
jgi:hypothetical protein